MTDIKEKFTDKYHPKNINEMILTTELKDHFNYMVKNKNLTDMTFIGPPGMGKTTLADILSKSFNASVLFIPCGLKGNIDTVKTVINDFVQALNIDDKIKIIILDEADQLSGSDSAQLASSAQKALRSIMGDKQHTDVRWILTANYENKIIAPIKSRCPVKKISYTAKDLIERIQYILKAENIKYDIPTLKKFAQIVIKKHYPDVRKILTLLQNNISSGELVIDDSENISNDNYDKFINELFLKLSKRNESPLNIRKYILQNKEIFNDDYSELANRIISIDSNLFNVTRLEKLIEIIYRMNNVIDPEIQMYGFITIIMNEKYD